MIYAILVLLQYAPKQSKYPPWQGCIPFVIGFVALVWSWIDMSSRERRWFSPVVFFGSVVLLSVGFYILLPWSVG